MVPTPTRGEPVDRYWLAIMTPANKGVAAGDISYEWNREPIPIFCEPPKPGERRGILKDNRIYEIT